MNFCDCYVTKVLSEPRYIDTYPDVQWWELDVKYQSWGVVEVDHRLTFKTKAEAEAVKEGFHFLA